MSGERVSVECGVCEERGGKEVVVVGEYDFSMFSVNDLARLLIETVEAGFPEDQGFIDAVREEIKRRGVSVRGVSGGAGSGESEERRGGGKGDRG